MKTLTVGFELKDNEETSALLENLKSKMVPFDQTPELPYSVFAISIHDEFQRLELIQQIIDSDIYEKIEAIQAILETPNPRAINSLDEL